MTENSLREVSTQSFAVKRSFYFEADSTELKLFATMRSEELRPYIEHNITLLMEIEVLRRRLLKLGIPEDELRWAQKEACEKVREAIKEQTTTGIEHRLYEGSS